MLVPNASVLPRPLLAITGPAFPCIDFVRYHGSPEINKQRFTIGGRTLYTSLKGEEDETAPSDLEEHTIKTASAVWDCSIVLAKYLERHALPLNLKNARTIELGSGRGLAGMAAAALGSRVTLTDAPTAVDSLRRIVEVVNEFPIGTRREGESGVEAVEPLDWTNREQHLLPLLADRRPYDLIIGADIVWVEWLVSPLVATINDLLTRNPGALCLLSHQTRSTRAEEKLFRELELCGIDRQLAQGNMDLSWWKEGVNIFELRKKSKELHT